MWRHSFLLIVLNEDFRALKDALENLNTRKSIACENSRFSSLLAAGDVSRGGTFAIQRQKFHTDDNNNLLFRAQKSLQ